LAVVSPAIGVVPEMPDERHEGATAPPRPTDRGVRRVLRAARRRV